MASPVSLATTGLNLVMANDRDRETNRRADNAVANINADLQQQRREARRDLDADLGALRARNAASGLSGSGTAQTLLQARRNQTATELREQRAEALRNITNIRANSRQGRRRNLLSTASSFLSRSLS